MDDNDGDNVSDGDVDNGHDDDVSGNDVDNGDDDSHNDYDADGQAQGQTLTSHYCHWKYVKAWNWAIM